ncbi:MAG: toll/interleukin-1 receptor domain-containing protein [Actinomycetes bacterium]
MPLSRTVRFRLKSQLIDGLVHDQDGWDLRRQNLLLYEFGYGTLDGDWNGPTFEDLISQISDADLIEMYSVVTGVELAEVQDSLDAADTGNWKNGYVRLFVSHSAVHKQFVGAVADELAVVGIHGFVAHDTMEVSRPWQWQIEQALQSAQAFVALVHPEFNSSAWCQQEVGWAFGRRIPRHAVRMGGDPVGFIGSDQWHSGASTTAQGVAALISTWVASLPELGETMVGGLFAALENSNNYVDAGATAARIATLGGLTEDQWVRLHDIYWKNDQIHGGVLPTKALAPFYAQNGREWPPLKPAPPKRVAVIKPGRDEPPF